ncbi:steroid receptor RNA activator 1-like [Phlebotomus papatasi]|uniref:steroid receptor RNA activator 1-like n=1 Tax=Phlebotomus papatasi TaxID=29031 RepID=UPI002483B349|nr:steroid receptor RNA activator 1-like [Phlebotomus papatasi]
MSEKESVTKPPFDPGWNDPPKLGYEEQAKSSPNRTKLNLNKRIAFPLSSPGGGATAQKVELAPSGLPMPYARMSTKEQPSTIIPPTTSSSSDLKPPPSSLGVNSVSGDALDVSRDTQETISADKLLEILKDFEVFARKIDDKKVQEEVSRRLSLLRDQVCRKQLSEGVKSRLVRICEALKEENYTEANQINRSLMVDYLSECCSWGSSLRNIILAAQPQDEAINSLNN